MSFGIPCLHCDNTEEHHDYLKEGNYKKLQKFNGHQIEILKNCSGYEPKDHLLEIKLYCNNLHIPKMERLELTIKNLSTQEKYQLEKMLNDSFENVIKKLKIR
jgi:hypothetical protein